MSFILDALRKSEHERHRQAGPGIADLQPVSIRHRLPVWAIGLAALLLVNIVVVLVLVLRDPTPAAAAAVNAPVSAPPQTQTPAATAAPTGSQSSGARNDAYALPPPVLPRNAPASEFADAQPSAGYPPPARPAMSADVPRADPQLAQRPEPQEQPESEENLPSVNDLAMQGAARVPEMHLDIHVYSGAPAERFVFLNMRKYREGDSTPEGTRIERITREGVVLNHHGLRYKLPRQ